MLTSACPSGAPATAQTSTSEADAEATCRNVHCIDTGVHVEEFGHLSVAEVPDRLTLHRVART